MEGLHLIISTVIALCALLAGLGLIFNALLDPVKQNQERFEGELKDIKAGQIKLENGQVKLEARMEARIDKLEDKIDKLIAKN